MKKSKTELKAEIDALQEQSFQKTREIENLIAAHSASNEVIIELSFLLTAQRNILRVAEKVNNSWAELTLEGPVTDALRELRKTFQKPVSEVEEAQRKRRERETALRIMNTLHRNDVHQTPPTPKS